MAASATYVYCVVHRGGPVGVRRMPPGVPGSSRPALLDISDGLSIAVSTVPLDVYAPEQIERRLHDLDWVANIALAHEAVVEHIGKIGGATVVEHQLDVAEHALQRIVELMGDSGDELPQCGQLLRLRQAIAQFGAFGFELLSGREHRQAFRSGAGAALGFLAGTVVEFAVALGISVSFVIAFLAAR